MRNILSAKILSVLVALNLLIISSFIWPANIYGMSDFEAKLRNLGSNVFGLKQSIEKQRRETRAKINELKLREKIEISKLYRSQDKLEQTKGEILQCNVKLDVAKGRLSHLESQLGMLSSERQASAYRASERIKQIYKGERVSLLHLIFAAKDINTFLDRVYYQKRLAVHDKNLLEDLRIKTNRLAATKQGIENQKNDILGTINVMSQKKGD